jgi:hypothetical protein
MVHSPSDPLLLPDTEFGEAAAAAAGDPSSFNNLTGRPESAEAEQLSEAPPAETVASDSR